MTDYPAAIVEAFRLLCRAQARANAPGLRLAQRTARRGAQTRASKEFSRLCYAHGLDDAQAVADALTRQGIGSETA